METDIYGRAIAFSTGFNGAIAFWLWKLSIGLDIGHVEGVLQWGHSLLAMETRARGISLAEYLELQWGHSLLAMETCPLEIYQEDTYNASMGP